MGNSTEHSISTEHFTNTESPVSDRGAFDGAYSINCAYGLELLPSSLGSQLRNATKLPPQNLRDTHLCP